MAVIQFTCICSAFVYITILSDLLSEVSVQVMHFRNVANIYKSHS